MQGEFERGRDLPHGAWKSLPPENPGTAVRVHPHHGRNKTSHSKPVLLSSSAACSQATSHCRAMHSCLSIPCPAGLCITAEKLQSTPPSPSASDQQPSAGTGRGCECPSAPSEPGISPTAQLRDRVPSHWEEFLAPRRTKTAPLRHVPRAFWVHPALCRWCLQRPCICLVQAQRTQPFCL